MWTGILPFLAFLVVPRFIFSVSLPHCPVSQPLALTSPCLCASPSSLSQSPLSLFIPQEGGHVGNGSIFSAYGPEEGLGVAGAEWRLGQREFRGALPPGSLSIIPSVFSVHPPHLIASSLEQWAWLEKVQLGPGFKFDFYH